jgi:hypothetical protein
MPAVPQLGESDSVRALGPTALTYISTGIALGPSCVCVYPHRSCAMGSQRSAAYW